MARASGFGLASGLMVRTAALWVCGLSLATWSAAALPAQDDRTPTLHVYANLVQIPTLVVDRDQGPVAPIAEGRFFVSVDGGPKFRVTHVRPEGDDPISLAIVLDVSQAFPNLTMGIDDAIAGLAPLSLHAKDHVSVYSMDCKLVRSVNGAPADSVTLKQAVDVALQPWKTHGRERWTSECKEPLNLWDSLAAVSRALSQQPGRRVILVVTDELDRGSKTTWNELRELAQERGVAIFGLSQTGDSMFRVGSRTFNSLCEMSGGIVLTASEEEHCRTIEAVCGPGPGALHCGVSASGGYDGRGARHGDHDREERCHRVAHGDRDSGGRPGDSEGPDDGAVGSFECAADGEEEGDQPELGGRAVRLLAQASDKVACAGGEFRVILFLPGGAVGAQEGEQLAAAHFGARGQLILAWDFCVLRCDIRSIAIVHLAD
jgi:hypothetical protein